jgi:hypothetical protein
LSIYDQIYALAEPYWDTRGGMLHMPVAYDMAKRLLAAIPEGDPSIVLPAILLHDIGYALVPEETHMQGLADGAKGFDPEITRRHEIEGAKLAGELLAQVGYDPDKTRLIQEIVDGHDSRREAISLDDAIVKDADKLWRYTPAGTNTSRHWFDLEVEPYFEWVDSKLDTWLLTDVGRDMARSELEKTRATIARDAA